MATALAAPYWRRTLTSGVGLVTVTIVGSNLLRILSTIVLTRVLSPADFGMAGVTAALLAVLMMISDLGFGVFIVQHRNGNDPHLLDVIWTVRLVRALVLTLGLAVAAGPLADLLAKPEMQAAIAITALHFLVDGLGSLAPMTAVRQQKLLVLSGMDMICAVAQTMLGIALALSLRNYWALIIAGLAAVGLRSLLSYAMFPRSVRRLAFDKDHARELWRFGRTIASAHTIQVLLSQVDRFVLSRVFPLNLFGLYTIASNLATAPSAFTTLYPNRVLLPAYARTMREQPDRLAHTYYSERRTVMLLYLLAMGGFIGMAAAVTDILYDARYAGAADYLRLLALAPLVGLNNYAAREALIVVGRVRSLFIANLVRLGWLAAAGTAGFLAFGPMGLIAAVGMIEMPVQIYCWIALRSAGLLRWRGEALMFAAAVSGWLAGVGVEHVYFVLRS